MLLVGVPGALAAPVVSANEVIEGCRAIASGNWRRSEIILAAVHCNGIIEGASTTAAVAGWVCPPQTAIMSQTVKVVVQYLDVRPARLHESFVLLALEALIAAWPCGGSPR